MEYLPELLQKIREQLYLISISISFAILLGVPLGVLAQQNSRLKSLILASSAILWTIPTLALFVLFIPVVGIGTLPAVITLIIYALLPIIRNTLIGMEQISPVIIEAARELGSTNLQRIRDIELPLASPIILEGIRTAIIITVGGSTLAAFVGAGGLGDFINQGLATNNSVLLLMGAIPAVLLALAIDYIFTLKKLIIVLLMLLGLALGVISSAFSAYQQQTLVVASKNFTEQFILAELISQLIEANSNIKVIRKFNLGTTAICHQAMLKGEIDIYPEYTGTAYLTVLKKSYSPLSADALWQKVKNEYQKKFSIIWLKPFGFENSQALAITSSFSKKNNVYSISDLVPQAEKLTVGALPEFLSREDGMPKLKSVYGLVFSSIKALDSGLLYQAIANKKVGAIMAFSTDGRIPLYKLQILKDDLNAFPSYYAAPLIRASVAKEFPQITKILIPVLGKLNNEMIQQLNYSVDIKKKSPKKVVREFLITNNLIK